MKRIRNNRSAQSLDRKLPGYNGQNVLNRLTRGVTPQVHSLFSIVGLVTVNSSLCSAWLLASNFISSLKMKTKTKICL